MIAVLWVVTGILALAVSRWFALMAAILAAATRRRFVPRAPAAGVAGSTRFLIVIPAHDEAPVVGITVRSCLAVDYDPTRFQVVVIADNCADDTASVAEAAGAQVVVRTDPARKSKGFALQDFFAAVPANPSARPHDAYVLVDADTSVAPDLLRAFDQSIRLGDDFVQGYYTVRNAAASWRTRLMTYAFSLANGVWLAGLDPLGLSVGLKGNGMCFRAAALRRFPWRAHGLVEDMEFAWHLRIGGERVRFQPAAQVFGEMVSRGGAGAASQRQRWESGRRALKARFRQELRDSPHLSRVEKLVYQGELAYPPLGRLGISLGMVSALAIVGLVASGRRPEWWGIVGLLTLDWSIFAGYALSPILIVQLPFLSLLSLFYLPYYVVWKSSLRRLKPPGQWVRTPRESAPPR